MREEEVWLLQRVLIHSAALLCLSRKGHWVVAKRENGWRERHIQSRKEKE